MLFRPHFLMFLDCGPPFDLEPLLIDQNGCQQQRRRNPVFFYKNIPRIEIATGATKL